MAIYDLEQANLISLEEGDVININYTGSVQILTLSDNINKIKIECYGAGAYNATYGGRGGYAKGIYELGDNYTLYLYVGGKGVAAGGYNGGGKYAGGGTDVRTLENDLNSRIIVAGGGGGYTTRRHYTSEGSYSSTSYLAATGHGGGYSGGDAGGSYNEGGFGGTQTAGGARSSRTGGTAGSFGQGGDPYNYYGGGGGGWYGGGGGGYYKWHSDGDNNTGGGGGGSSYIEGLLDAETIMGGGSNADQDGKIIITIIELNSPFSTLNGEEKNYEKRWVLVNGKLKEIDTIWTKINGELKQA